MITNELSVSNVVGELVKNSIDAQCTVVQVEINGSFDIRVIDDGCGFYGPIMQDVCERQLFLSDALQINRFRYGKHGKSLFRTAQITSEIYIESIQHNTDVRLYKTIIENKSIYKVYQTDRNSKDAMVKTLQGSMIVLNTLKVSFGNDAVMEKMNIVNTVVDLALINFEINISVKDTATQQTLYESYRTENLFEKFEQLLESNQFFSKIQSISCEKHDVKVELLLCDDGTPGKAFQFVYFNKLREHEGKWTKIINKLCKKRFKNDLNSKFPVYLLNICATKYFDNQLAHNVVIDNCIRKCVEQLSQSPSKSCVVQPTTSNAAILNNDNATCSKDPPPVPEENGNGNENEMQGVRLGDWIFNNSCENYEQLNQGRDVYRKKICENWVISLEKPKPKDVNDSLNIVDLNACKVPQDDHLFKKPKPRKIRGNTTKMKPKPTPQIKPLPHVSTQIYRPSQQIKAFDDSSLIRASKKLILNTEFDNKRKNSAKNRIKNQLEMKAPKLRKRESRRHHKNLFDKTTSSRMKQMQELDAISSSSFEHLNGPNEVNNEFSFPNQPSIHMPNIAEKSKDHFQIYRSTENILDFTLHKSKRATNFNMNFTSSIAIHTMADDPFKGILENDACDVDVNSISNLFESNTPAASNRPQHRTSQSVSNHRSRGSSFYSQTSQFEHRQSRSDSVHTRYRQRTYYNFNSGNSTTQNRNDVSSGADERNGQPRSIQNSSHTGTTVVTPLGRKDSSLGVLGDEVRRSGWPVTININFGQPR